MNNPFPSNTVFTEFLGIKNYFRQHISQESVKKFKKIVRIARTMNAYNENIAFDILGSMNFGMAAKHSDIDLVLYIDCGHSEEATYDNTHKLWFYESYIKTELQPQLTDGETALQIVDCINLRRLEYAVDHPKYDDEIIARFVFYRTICRGINKRILRRFERKIQEDKELFKRIENQLTYALVEFTKTSSHVRSFKKYIDRLKDDEIYIPPSMFEKIMNYLNQ